MKYAVVTIEWLAQHGLLAIPTMRKSKDGSKVILHEEFLTPYKDEEFPVYYFDSPELNDLLASEEWSWTEEERPEGSAEYIQVAAAQNLINVTKSGIQTMSLTDGEALKVKSMYPHWNEFVGKSLTTGMKVQYDDKLTVLSENKGVYIDGSLTIRTISNEIFMVDVYEVVGGDTYSFRSSGFMLSDSYPAIIFSTTPFGVNVKADELILSASTTPEDVDIVYTVKNDGYIFIAHVSTKPNIDVYSTTKELVTDIHSRELHDLSQLSAIKGKNVAVLGDSIMMLMRTYNIGANTITYRGEDDIDYSYDNLTNVNGYLYVTSSLDEGSVVEGSIKCEIVNSQQSNYDSQDWKDLQEKLKAFSVINFGLGGATIAEKDIITPYPYPDQGDLTNCLSNEVRWLVRRYESAEIPSPDCFIIWLGTNGAGQPSTDNYDEIMDLDWATLSDDALGRQYRKTFYGGLRYSIEMLYRKFKNSTICVLTPIQTNPENYRTYEKLSVTASAIIKMSQRYSCIHIDALNEIGIVDLFEKNDGTGYWLSDVLHPNSNGKKLISNYLSQRIHSLYFSKN